MDERFERKVMVELGGLLGELEVIYNSKAINFSESLYGEALLSAKGIYKKYDEIGFRLNYYQYRIEENSKLVKCYDDVYMRMKKLDARLYKAGIGLGFNQELEAS